MRRVAHISISDLSLRFSGRYLGNQVFLLYTDFGSISMGGHLIALLRRLDGLTFMGGLRRRYGHINGYDCAFNMFACAGMGPS